MDRESLIFSFLGFMLLISFLIVLADKVWNSNGENGHVCLNFDYMREIFKKFTLSMMSAVGFS